MKNATFRQVKVFEAVARHLNYSRAAEELRMSQPGVSIHVRQLEAHAGLPLFEQLGKRIYLTPAGHEMLRYSRAIIQQLNETGEALAALKGIRGGRLDIAVISAGDYFFPGLLAEFCRRHERVTVRLTVNNREEIVHQLEENTTDLAVLLRPPGNPDMIAEAFAPQPHVIVAAPDHALARKRHISLQAVANEAFIVREQGSDTRLAMEELLAECRVKFNVTMEIKSTETIKQAVIAGMGISFLSAHTIGRELEAGRLALLDVEGFPVMRKWHIVHHKNKRLPPVAIAFKEFLLQEGAALIEKLVGRAVPKRKLRA
ncbi:MAG: LysR family transcriptional regulator [Betaproteobacteria bacterium]|nr:LysR family transcriptional regulator [Betaproteobacteria bacterium]MBI2293226.1 LysR family transcriptional regulator [Betaproteobacteria bacterium]MBI3054429.1 LysR family transcriptional regulator [Betaproteobacteria bacterium]